MALGIKVATEFAAFALPEIPTVVPIHTILS